MLDRITELDLKMTHWCHSLLQIPVQVWVPCRDQNCGKQHFEGKQMADTHESDREPSQLNWDISKNLEIALDSTVQWFKESVVAMSTVCCRNFHLLNGVTLPEVVTARGVYFSWKVQRKCGAGFEQHTWQRSSQHREDVSLCSALVVIRPWAKVTVTKKMYSSTVLK